MKLSIVIPVYNEKGWLLSFWERLAKAPITQCIGITETELVLVDDGSSDGTREILVRLCSQPFPFEDGSVASITFLANDRNYGKGYSVARGIEATKGEVVIIQDADLEYYVSDYPALIAPIIDGSADAVFGSRLAGSSRQVLYFYHALMNRLVTLLFNLVNNLDLTDMEACYKVFRGGIVRNLRLTSHRFGIEPELAARLSQAGVRVYEVPIRYSARRRSQGKKLRPFRDGFSALYHIFKFGLWDREPYKAGPMRLLHQLEQAKQDEFGAFLQKIMSRLDIINHSVRLLLVNGGIGGLCQQLMSYGKLVIADNSWEVVRTLRDRYRTDSSFEVIQWNPLSEIWDDPGKFDVIIACNLESPSTVDKLAKLLHVNGSLILLEQDSSRLAGYSEAGAEAPQKYGLSLENAFVKNETPGFALLRPIQSN